MFGVLVLRQVMEIQASPSISLPFNADKAFLACNWHHHPEQQASIRKENRAQWNWLMHHQDIRYKRQPPSGQPDQVSMERKKHLGSCRTLPATLAGSPNQKGLQHYISVKETSHFFGLMVTDSNSNPCRIYNDQEWKEWTNIHRSMQKSTTEEDLSTKEWKNIHRNTQS